MHLIGCWLSRPCFSSTDPLHDPPTRIHHVVFVNNHSTWTVVVFLIQIALDLRVIAGIPQLQSKSTFSSRAPRANRNPISFPIKFGSSCFRKTTTFWITTGRNTILTASSYTLLVSLQNHSETKNAVVLQKENLETMAKSFHMILEFTIRHNPTFCHVVLIISQVILIGGGIHCYASSFPALRLELQLLSHIARASIQIQWTCVAWDNLGNWQV